MTFHNDKFILIYNVQGNPTSPVTIIILTLSFKPLILQCKISNTVPNSKKIPMCESDTEKNSNKNATITRNSKETQLYHITVKILRDLALIMMKQLQSQIVVKIMLKVLVTLKISIDLKENAIITGYNKDINQNRIHTTKNNKEIITISDYDKVKDIKEITQSQGNTEKNKHIPGYQGYTEENKSIITKKSNEISQSQGYTKNSIISNKNNIAIITEKSNENTIISDIPQSLGIKATENNNNIPRAQSDIENKSKEIVLNIPQSHSTEEKGKHMNKIITIPNIDNDKIDIKPIDDKKITISQDYIENNSKNILKNQSDIEVNSNKNVTIPGYRKEENKPIVENKNTQYIVINKTVENKEQITSATDIKITSP